MEKVFIRVATGTNEVLLHESRYNVLYNVKKLSFSLSVRLQRQMSQQEEVQSPRQKVSPQPIATAFETVLTTEGAHNYLYFVAIFKLKVTIIYKCMSIFS